MSDKIPQNRAIEQLEQFGLREYEAKCFVSLTKITSGTAREVSEHIDVPRTRVYEAVRSLESDGLVEIQHSSPQQFRAISITEALELLEQRHQSRIESLEQSLRQLKETSDETGPQSDSEVWSLAGSDTIATRSRRLITEAETEILLLVGDPHAVSERVNEGLAAAADRGIDVVVGAGSESLRSLLTQSIPEQAVFASEFDWLREPETKTDLSVGRLLLTDRQGLLVSTVTRADGSVHERAVCGSGSGNGLVFVLRKLLSQQLDQPISV